MILNTVEQYLTLEQGRLPQQQIIEKIEAFRSPFGEGTLPLEPGLSEYIRYRLSVEDPAYLARGTRLFNKTLSTARAYIERKLAEAARNTPYPPTEWLKKQMSIAEAEAAYDACLFKAGVRDRHTKALSRNPKWEELKLRMLPGDELWSFTSPAEHWRNLCGREGFCLLRNSRPVAHITTVMN